jgi:acetoin utilization protein AcuB
MKANKPIRSIMTTELVTVSPETTAREVKDLFDKNSFHHLPVVAPGNKLQGIISRKDVAKVAYVLSLRTSGKTYSEKEYKRLTASDLMTQYPLSLDPDDTIGLAADIFLANKFHALPIIDDDELIGLVTTHDLLKYSFNSNVSEKVEEAYEEQ